MRTRTLFLMLIGLCANTLAADRQKAIDLNNRALKLSTEASISGDARNFHVALALLDSAISEDTTYHIAYWNKASILCKMGRTLEAIATLDEILRYSPDYSSALIQKGHMLEKVNRVQEARQCYRHVIRQVDSLAARGEAAPGDMLNKAYLSLFLHGKAQGCEELNELIRHSPNEKTYLEMQSFFDGFDRDRFFSHLCSGN